jgi:hypothetical protein
MYYRFIKEKMNTFIPNYKKMSSENKKHTENVHNCRFELEIKV